MHEIRVASTCEAFYIEPKLSPDDDQRFKDLSTAATSLQKGESISFTFEVQAVPTPPFSAWVVENGISAYEVEVNENFGIVLRFEVERDAVLFKMFW